MWRSVILPALINKKAFYHILKVGGHNTPSLIHWLFVLSLLCYLNNKCPTKIETGEHFADGFWINIKILNGLDMLIFSSPACPDSSELKSENKTHSWLFCTHFKIKEQKKIMIYKFWFA